MHNVRFSKEVTAVCRELPVPTCVQYLCLCPSLHYFFRLCSFLVESTPLLRGVKRLEQSAGCFEHLSPARAVSFLLRSTKRANRDAKRLGHPRRAVKGHPVHKESGPSRVPAGCVRKRYETVRETDYWHRGGWLALHC